MGSFSASNVGILLKTPKTGQNALYCLILNTQTLSAIWGAFGIRVKSRQFPKSILLPRDRE